MSGRLPLLRVLDVALALVVTAVGVAETWVPFSSRSGTGSLAATTLTVVLLGGALTQRRAHPLGAAVVALLALPVVFTVTPVYVLFFGQFVPMGIALFTVARLGAGRAPWYGAACAVTALLFLDLRVRVLQSPGEVVFHWGVFTIVWAFGWWLRASERRARESQARAVAAEVRAAERAMAAVLEERTRIARELHDIVAHSVSVIVVQAGAAEQVAIDDPEHARAALATIRATGTGALAEMRRVVAMLRDHDEVGALAPQPGVDALAALVDEARAAGLEVSLSVTGEPRALPVGLDLATYRIAQEALTNVRRHAAASRVTVELAYGPGDLRIEVRDDGVGAPAEPSGGHGLVGMRERAALYGGHLETVSAAGCGFTVRAVLPVVGP